MESTESALVRQASEGDRKAFESLVRSYEKKVYTLAYRMSHNPDDAFDLSQEIFLRVYKSLAFFKGESSFSTWLYRLASNTCLDHVRKEKRRREQPLTVHRPDGEEHSLEWPDIRYSPESEFEKNELRQAIASAMQSLSPEHRAILTLRDIQGLSYEEISEALSLQAGTVKSRLARARESLRAVLVARGNFFESESSNPSKGR